MGFAPSITVPSPKEHSYKDAILHRAAAIVAELSDTRRLTEPLVEAQLATMHKTVHAQGIDLDDPNEAELKRMFQQQVAVMRMQMLGQRDGIMKMQLATLLQAVADLIEEQRKDTPTAMEQLQERCAAHAEASPVVETWWPRLNKGEGGNFFGLTAVEQTAVNKSAVFMKQFLTCADRDDSGERISKQAYNEFMRRNFKDNQHAPELQEFFQLGLSLDDVVQAFTESLPQRQAWVSYLDAYSQTIQGSHILGQRVIQAVMGDDSDDDDSTCGAYDEGVHT